VRTASVLLLAALLLAPGAAAGRLPATRVVAPGGFLVADRQGGLEALGSTGKRLFTVPWGPHPLGVDSMALAADRAHAFVSLRQPADAYGNEQPNLLESVDLRTGKLTPIGNGDGPAVSPDGTRLAYLSTAVSTTNALVQPTALTVLNLQTGATRSIAVASPLAAGPLNWSPDGTRIAVSDGTQIRLVLVASAQDLASQPTLPGDANPHAVSPRMYAGKPSPPTTPATPGTIVVGPPPPGPNVAISHAPVFVDAHTVVVDYDCCIGDQHLVAFDLGSGAKTAFATLTAPAWRDAPAGAGRVLLVTPDDKLEVARRGSVTTIATGITAAAYAG
jgi:dipeptidyl aminopeptidase/acylaminoacyl peptidase